MPTPAQALAKKVGASPNNDTQPHTAFNKSSAAITISPRQQRKEIIVGVLLATFGTNGYGCQPNLSNSHPFSFWAGADSVGCLYIVAELSDGFIGASGPLSYFNTSLERINSLRVKDA